VRAAVLLLIAALTACASERSSPECKEVCRKHARCVDQKVEAAQSTSRAPAVDEQIKFDQGECVDDCNLLRRSAEGEQKVDRHVACVTKAEEDCAGILACQ
jgi:hypothetical protein